MADRTSTTASFGAAIGRTTVSAGLLLLAFAAYQLWGTGLAEARAQEELAAELAADVGRNGSPGPNGLRWAGDEPGLGPAEPVDAALVVDHGAPGATEVAGSTPVRSELVDSTAIPASLPLAAPTPLEVGGPIAALRIPAIGVDKTVVEGTTREALRSGPGHYRGTARPGQAGNVAIAGHRTTYGAPFRDIDQLVPGDPIVVETADGTFTYLVEAQSGADGTTSGHRIVAPEDVEVIADRGDHRLTLTACHPLYSARQRIVVTAVLERPASAEEAPGLAAPTGLAKPAVLAEPTGMAEPAVLARPEADLLPTTSGLAGQETAGPGTAGPGIDERAGLAAPSVADPVVVRQDDLGWQPAHAPATAGWAALTILVVAASFLLGRLWRPVPAYLMAGPSFTLCLLTCFGHLDQLIPAA